MGFSRSSLLTVHTRSRLRLLLGCRNPLTYFQKCLIPQKNTDNWRVRNSQNDNYNPCNITLIAAYCTLKSVFCFLQAIGINPVVLSTHVGTRIPQPPGNQPTIPMCYVEPHGGLYIFYCHNYAGLNVCKNKMLPMNKLFIVHYSM